MIYVRMSHNGHACWASSRSPSRSCLLSRALLDHRIGLFPYFRSSSHACAKLCKIWDSNAYFFGFHKNKRIVLFDTLLNKPEREKITAFQESEPSVAQSEKSTDPAQRGMAFDMVGQYHGYFELDNYPLTLTQEEANKRYSK